MDYKLSALSLVYKDTRYTNGGKRARLFLNPEVHKQTVLQKKNHQTSQTFKNTWIVKISINKHGTMLATGFELE